MIQNGFLRVTNPEGLAIMQHVEDGNVLHEWLIDDEEYTHWYLAKALYETAASVE